MTDHISWRQFRESAGVEDWRNLGGGAAATFRAPSYAEAARFAAAVGELPGAESQRPAIDIRGTSATIQLVTITDEYSGMSERDVTLAREISASARAHGLVAQPWSVQSFQIYVGVPSAADVLPFWQAVMGYEPAPGAADEGVVDPGGRGPGVWIERMDAPRPDGGGAIHICVWVPHEEADARVAAAIAAGGRLVRGENAPAWWTLADDAGNEVDIATTLGRD